MRSAGECPNCDRMTCICDDAEARQKTWEVSASPGEVSLRIVYPKGDMGELIVLPAGGVGDLIDALQAAYRHAGQEWPIKQRYGIG